jgi:hypothetical protein
MTQRVFVSAVLVCLLVVFTASPLLADCGCVGPGPRGPRGPSQKGTTVSGLGVGLGGIALSWGAMSIGLRLARWRDRK